jgi:hypothetical protein
VLSYLASYTSHYSNQVRRLRSVNLDGLQEQGTSIPYILKEFNNIGYLLLFYPLGMSGH